jgi:DNA modification methylase
MKKWMIEFYNVCPRNNSTIILRRDCRDYNTSLNGDITKVEDESIGLVITSPPYCNALDYSREHDINMIWLRSNIKDFKKAEIGAHSKHIANRIRLISEYISDMYRAISEINRVLKHDKILCILIGDSTTQFEAVKSSKIFFDMAPQIGFKKIGIIKRNIDTERKYTSPQIGRIQTEDIVILQKKKYIEPCDQEIFAFVKQQLKKTVKLEKNRSRLEEALLYVESDCKFNGSFVVA